MKTKKVKALFALIIVCFFVLTGCVATTGDISLLENAFFAHTVYVAKNNKITETILVNFAPTQLETAQKQILVAQLNNLFATKKLELNSYIAQKIDKIDNMDMDEQEKQAYKNQVAQIVVSNEIEGEKVMIKITYQNSKSWNYFSSFSTQPTTQKTFKFFTYTYTDHTQKTGTVIKPNSQEMFFGDFMKQFVFDWMEIASANTVESLQVKSVYSYITYFSRRHSNAHSIALFGQNYFHIWNTTEPTEITLYLILPRVQNWYYVALALSFATLGIVFLVSYFSKNKKENAPQGDTDQTEHKPRIKTFEQ